jgi:hypothetical protein
VLLHSFQPKVLSLYSCRKGPCRGRSWLMVVCAVLPNTQHTQLHTHTHTHTDTHSHIHTDTTHTVTYTDTATSSAVVHTCTRAHTHTHTHTHTHIHTTQAHRNMCTICAHILHVRHKLVSLVLSRDSCSSICCACAVMHVSTCILPHLLQATPAG